MAEMQETHKVNGLKDHLKDLILGT